jgi:hypothetical protein
MTKPKPLLKYIVVVLFSLTGCGQSIVKLTPTSECIGSFERLVYEWPNDENETPGKILPLEPWEIEADLPDLSGVPYPTNRYDVEMIRSFGDHSEIWLSNFDGRFYDAEKAPYYRFLVYNTDNKEWESFSAETTYSSVYVGRLFIDQDGIIWGQNFYDGVHRRIEISFLSKFNPVIGRFEIVWEAQRIPAASHYATLPTWVIVYFDDEHLFWVIVSGDGIYSYDTFSQMVERQVKIPDIELKATARAEDGSIFITSYPTVWYENSIQEEGIRLFQFIPGNIQLESVPWPTERWPSFALMLADSSGRLWFDAVGWYDNDGSWQLIYPHPTTYFWKAASRPNSYHSNPSAYVRMESSDGRIWFEKEARGQGDWQGLAWFNPETEKGCWFTTEQGVVIEDAHRNVWLAVDGKLFRVALDP